MPERSGLLTKYYEEAKYYAAFDRCVDVMSRLMQKYGHQVLEQHKAKGTTDLGANKEIPEKICAKAA